MKMKFSRLLLLLSLIPCRWAYGTVLEELSLEEIVLEADEAFEGVVQSKTSRFDANGRIVTDVEVKVVGPIFGKLENGDVRVVTVLGGVVGTMGQIVPGAPRFSVGERVVLFVRCASSTTMISRRTIVGFSQGAFWVFRDSRGKERVRQRLEGALLDTGLEGEIEMDLEELLERVRWIRGEVLEEEAPEVLRGKP